MPRIARVVIPDYPHHIIQRGSRNQTVFFCDSDKRLYLTLLKRHAHDSGVKFWAYCLMDNHIHLIAVPKAGDSLSRCLAEAHRKYALFINLRNNWKGHLWQSRFISYPLDGKYLYAAVRYVERNPVRAGMVNKAEDYQWSSAAAHVFKSPDELLSDNFLISEISDWKAFLAGEDERNNELFRKHSRTCRPLGDDAFLTELEQKTGRVLRRRKPGPKIKELSILSP